MAELNRNQLDIGGLQTSYLSAGDHAGEPVVLLHDGAWGGSAEGSWSGVIPILARHYRVIAPDLYGYGRSSKMVQLEVAPHEFRLRQVAALLDALGLGGRRSHFVGNSFGGAMALRAVTTPWFAWRMRSAVSITGTGGPYRTEKSLTSLSHFDGSREDMRRIVRLLTGDFDGFEEHVDLRLRDASNASHYRAVASAGLATPFATGAKPVDDYPQSLQDTTVPIALVSGRNDDLVEPDWAHKIARCAPLSMVFEVEARHSPNISEPTATANLLVDILNKCDQHVPQQAGRL